MINNGKSNFTRRISKLLQNRSVAVSKSKKVISPEISTEPDFLVTNNDEIIITDKNRKIITN